MKLRRRRPEPPACSRASGCPLPACWRVTSECCGHVVVLCDTHRLERIRFLSVWPAPWRTHVVCGKVEAGFRDRWEMIGEAGR